MNHIYTSSLVLHLAVIPKDEDIMYKFQTAFNIFIKSGQVWALLIGVALGYIFAKFTSY